MQRHMPENRNILLRLSENIKKKKRTRAEVDKTRKGVVSKLFDYIVCLITAVDRGRALFYFIKFLN